MNCLHRVRLMMASLLLLGLASAANATVYDYGSVALSAPGSAVNAPGAITVGNGDFLSVKGVWYDISDIAGITTTSMYFTTAYAGTYLSGTELLSGYGASPGTVADLFLVTGVDTLIHSFALGVTPLVHLAAQGVYRLDVTVDTTGAPVNRQWSFTTHVVPLPAAAWLLLSGVVGLGAMARRRKVAAEA